ncbi:hypothetical protein G6F68_018729 [Rhizopus microsporus]|nr:hypothetical protein G6F68_018729 [Rhizopus microsporus]
MRRNVPALLIPRDAAGGRIDHSNSRNPDFHVPRSRPAFAHRIHPQRQPRRAVHEGPAVDAAVRFLGQGRGRPAGPRRRVRPRQRAGRPGNP